MLLATTLAACEFPTAPPRFESSFLIPGENTVLAVNELLPDAMTVQGDVFLFTIAATNFTRSLADLCGAPCGNVAPFVAPKPGFSATFEFAVTLPGEVASAMLTAGSISLHLEHDFAFDLLQPSGRNVDGSISITLRNGTNVVGTTVIDQPFAGGAPGITELITLQPGTIAGDIDIEFVLESPESTDPVLIDPSNRLTITAAPTGVTISEAAVNLNAQSVSVDQVMLELANLDETMTERVKGGAMVVAMTNPFAIDAAFTLNITGGAQPITRAIAIAPDATTQRLTFSEADLHAILGHNVTLSISGIVDEAAPVTVRPNQEITINTRLELVLEIGA